MENTHDGVTKTKVRTLANRSAVMKALVTGRIGVAGRLADVKRCRVIEHRTDCADELGVVVGEINDVVVNSRVDTRRNLIACCENADSSDIVEQDDEVDHVEGGTMRSGAICPTLAESIPPAADLTMKPGRWCAFVLVPFISTSAPPFP